MTSTESPIARLIFVDPNPETDSYVQFFSEHRFDAMRVEDAAAALKIVEQIELLPFLIITETKLNGLMDWHTFMERLGGINPAPGVLVLTGAPELDTAIPSVRLGVDDYLTKPIDPEQLQLAVERSLERRQLLRPQTPEKHLQVLVEALRQISDAPDLASLYPIVCDVVTELIPDSHCGAYLINHDETGLYADAQTKLTSEQHTQSARFLSWLFQERPSKFNRLRLLRQNYGVWRIRELLGKKLMTAPLRHRTHFLGTLFVSRRVARKPFTRRERELVATIADHAAKTHLRLQRSQQASEQAFIDSLTGLYNEHYLQFFAEQEIQRARRKGYPLTLMLLDIDQFSQINNVHGHLIGSELIREVSQVIKSMVREMDVVIRPGSDEFMLLLIDTDLKGAGQLAQRIAPAVADHDYRVKEDLKFRARASCAMASFPEQGDNLAELIAKARKSLRETKSGDSESPAAASA